MPKIFVSYRHEDSSGWTGRLASELQQRFRPENVFIDIHAIALGADFMDAIDQAIEGCDVLLAVIGPHWLDATSRKGEYRLENPDDYVALEISVALQRDIPVIPVLVGEATVPSQAELPQRLQKLARRQAHELSAKRWRYDADRLIDRLMMFGEPSPPVRAAPLSAEPPPAAGMPRSSPLLNVRTKIVVSSMLLVWLVFNLAFVKGADKVVDNPNSSPVERFVKGADKAVGNPNSSPVERFVKGADKAVGNPNSSPVERWWPTAVGAGIALFIFSWLYFRQKKRAQIEREKVLQQLDELKFALEKTTTKDEKYESTVLPAGQEQRERSIPDIPDELISAFASQNCILFAGGGISAQAGLPTWGLGLRQILDRAAILDPSQDWDTLRKGLEQGEMFGVSELIRARLPGEALAQICDEVFGGPTTVRTSRIHSVLRDLPFTGVLTTSWDRTLDAAFEARHPSILSATNSQQFGEIVREKKFFLLKLYGDPSKPKEFLFTPEEYRKATYENESFAKSVNSIYLSNTILFAGASLKGIDYFLAGLRINPDGDRRHFAIVPEEPGMEIEAERFQTKYGIQLLTYQPTPGFPELVQFFENLRARLNALPVSVKPNELVPLTIDRIRLENIGSFENLDLAFNSTWNVLLGNNGCGKSTILKAIALCLCGDDNKAKDVAGYLLRSQTSRGTIEIWVGPQKYTTTLIRDGRTINLKFEQVTPLQAKRWVVLGFPPLRGISEQNPKGPSGSDGSPNPEVSDLLPLISGTVDNRLDNLKQWIVNLAMRAEPGGKNSAEDQKRCDRMINSFFDLLGEITPGVDFEFHKVDPLSWSIILKTQDGEVPLDAISQGTSSVLGWIGTLLQRMYEIYRNSDEPEKQPALVMVDEIDAHMHPAWQQVLVRTLRNLFPRVQFLATSHSPLVVAGLTQDEIWILRRVLSAQRSVVEITRPPADLKGWRVDQILASSAFDETGARDPDTVELISTYTELAAKENPSSEDRARLEKASKELKVRLPAPVEREHARKAFEIIQEFAQAQLSSMPVEEKKKVSDELKVQLQEGITGSRRPL